MDPDGSVWSLRTPWGLPGALGGPERGVKGGSPPGGARGALLGGLPISPSWANRLPRLPISLRGILTYTAAWPSYVVGPIELKMKSSILTWLRGCYANAPESPGPYAARFAFWIVGSLKLGQSWNIP